jgi:hypothetical protein
MDAEVIEEVEEPVIAAPVEPEVTEEETPASKDEVQPAAEKTEGTDKPSDWTATLSEEAQKEINRLKAVERNAKAEAGRVPWLQRKLDELEKKLHETTAPAKQPLPTTSGSPASSSPAPTNKELMDALAQIEEVDPVTAKAMKLILGEAQNSVKKTESLLHKRDEESYIKTEYARLVEMVPQAPTVFKLPEWRMWKEEQSPGIMALASSDNADDVYYALKKFAEDMQAKSGVDPAPKVEKKVETPVAAKTVDPKQAAITEQRTRRLAATAPTGGGPPTKVDISPKDADALFSQAYKEIRKSDHLVKKS